MSELAQQIRQAVAATLEISTRGNSCFIGETLKNGLVAGSFVVQKSTEDFLAGEFVGKRPLFRIENSSATNFNLEFGRCDVANMDLKNIGLTAVSPQLGEIASLFKVFHKQDTWLLLAFNNEIKFERRVSLQVKKSLRKIVNLTQLNKTAAGISNNNWLKQNGYQRPNPYF